MPEPSLLELKTTDDLLALRWQDFSHRYITQAEFMHVLTLAGAYWQHNGDATRPHVELTTGLCSDSLVDVLRALRFAPVCQLFAEQSARRIRASWAGAIDWVVGSSHAAATFSYAVASFLGTQHDFTEKGSGGAQVWNRFAIGQGQTVLQVEDLITTGKTFHDVRAAMRLGNPDPVSFAPIVFTLVRRTNISMIEDSEIVSLFSIPITTYEPTACPLCAVGSPRLRPKQNWVVLTGRP